MEILKNIFLTKNLSPIDIKVIADAMYIKEYEDGVDIITYGDLG